MSDSGIITIKLLLWFIVILANTTADASGRKPFYLVMFILRAMAAIVHGSLFVDTDYHWMRYWIPVLTFEVTSFWIFFELILNIAQKRKLLYYDQKEGDSGWIDRFFKWAGPTWHLVAKIMVFVIMVLSIILVYYNG